MVLISLGPRNHQRGLKTIAVVCVFLSSIFEQVHSLAGPFLQIRSASVRMTGGCNGIMKTHLNFRHCNKDDDCDRDAEPDYKYAYVHPSIRDVLLMEPRDIDPNAKNGHDSILVNGVDLTIRWDVLENFLEHKTSKTKTKEFQNIISMEQLVVLASQCDAALFNDCNEQALSKVPTPARGLLRILPVESCLDPQHLVGEEGGAHILVATLLALNMVENSIRQLIGKKNGKAPLLKDMIEMMASREGENALPNSVVSVLRTLLLPKNGLNLRNLVWHGFLPTIPRRWLSLSMVLMLSLDKLTGSSSFETTSLDGNPKSIAGMRKHKALVTILDHGTGILESAENLNSLKETMIQSSIIPKSHMELFEVALKYVHHPVVFASVMGPLIEHLLRLMWCDENNQDKRIATPGSYYVTLDGHGQKDKHEIVVMPFFSQEGVTEGVRNKLVYRLGGSTMAFFMDMFTSPSGGPNIRATVAHGSFNDHLFDELVTIEGEAGATGINTEEFMDITKSLLAVLSVLCENGHNKTTDTDVKDISNGKSILRSYQPCFSYSALLLAEIHNMVDSMESLHRLICNGHHLKYAMNSSHQDQKQIETAQKMSSMSPGFEAIIGMQQKICLRFGKSMDDFADENFFQESSNNLIVSECGAAKLLLSEIAEAASSSLQDIDDGISALESEQGKSSSRRRKQVARICATAQLTLDFYSFAAYCALLFIERRQDTASGYGNMDLHKKIENHPANDELFVAVKRSRMVVSTFSTSKNLDRALSALSQYVTGKAIKSVSQSLCNSSINL